MSLRRLIPLLLLTLILSACGKKKSKDTEQYLKEFHENPKEVMNKLPEKLDENGNVVERPDSPFSESDIKSKAYLAIRDQIREDICTKAGFPNCSASITPNSVHSDQTWVKKFSEVDNVLNSIDEIEKQNLHKGFAAVSPWSDSYWPIPRGAIGRRFADPGFPNSKDWTTNYNYISSAPPYAISEDRLSPAEKYDLLLGDSSWSLSRANWGAGKRYIDTYGFVPSWTGYCHGWSPASIVYPQPTRSVTVRGVGGRQVTFHPSDLKALASSLYAEAPPMMNFIGTRCKKFNPREDEMGRMIDEDCFDTNPGSYHLALVNRIGIQKRSFVFDSTFDYEVWNYPVYGYKFTYFNPQTLAVAETIHGSVIPMNRFTIDKFRKYRSPNSKYVIGVAVDLTYAIPSQPTTKDGYVDPRYHTVRYVYDLELDQDKKIIGGEWYSNFHPDFIWAPPQGAKALSRGEKELEAPVSWDGVSEIPADLVKAARRSSSAKEPVGAIVDTLIRLGQPEATAPQQ